MKDDLVNGGFSTPSQSHQKNLRKYLLIFFRQKSRLGARKAISVGETRAEVALAGTIPILPGPVRLKIKNLLFLNCYKKMKHLTYHSHETSIDTGNFLWNSIFECK